MDPSKVAPTPESKLHFLDYWRIIRIRKTVILAVFLLVVITATLVTFILPESYSSRARIRVDRDQPDISGLQQSSLSGIYDPYFIQTEFEVIQSEVILGKVIEEMDLRRVWGKKYAGGDTLKLTEAMSLMKGRIDLRPVRNTSLIEIHVFSEDKAEAARLANAIADAYKAHRLAQRRERTLQGIKILDERFAEQEQKIRKAQDEVDRWRTELKIPDSIANEDVPTTTMSAETVRRIEGLRIEAQAEFVRQETTLRKLKELSPKELVQALPSTTQDTLLSSLLEQLTLAEQKLVSLRKEYGPEHSEVIKVSEQARDLQDKVQARVAGILVGLETRVDSLRQGLRNLEQEVEKATSVDIQKANESRPYFDAKRRLEELKRFSQVLTMKIYTERTDVELPKEAMVEIVDRATEGLKPVRPNKPLNIALGVIIGLVVGVGLAFFIEYLDTSVKTIDDVERSLGSPVLGVIPQNVGIILEEGAESPHAEAYRVLRTNLLFSRKDEKLNSVAVVSAGAGEGKSTTVFNLAAVFAQSGQRVLIVDSDLRRPVLHKMLRVTNNLGLTNYLLRQNTLEEVIQTTNLPTLDFMASGKLPSSSLGILSSGQMRDLINELKQHYDFVFFDSPPVMGVSDASILASEVDMTLQVIQYRRYPQPMNIRAKQLIEKVGGNLVGIVLNNINMSQDESYYYYSGYYHEYYSRDDDQEPVPPGATTVASAQTKSSGDEGDDKDRIDLKPKY
jgi:capsular exopolysaccharide synthesis family protein